MPFTRAVPIAGTVRVMVGVGGHGEAWGFLAGALFWDKLFVREICLNSACVSGSPDIYPLPDALPMRTRLDEPLGKRRRVS